MSSKRKPSKMWSHFALSDCKKKATCNHCHSTLSFTQSTMSNLGRHLKTKHSSICTAQQGVSPKKIYTVEEIGTLGIDTYEITMKGFEEMEQEEVTPPLSEPPDPDWTPQTSVERKEESAAGCKEKKVRKRSAVWNHFEKTTCKTSAVCTHCSKTIRLGTVSNLARHLRHKHPTTPFVLSNSANVKHEDSGTYDEQDFPILREVVMDSKVVEINVNDINNPISIIETTSAESTNINDMQIEFQDIEVVNDTNVTQSSQTEFLEDNNEDFDINDYIRPINSGVHAKQVDNQLVKMIVKGCHPLSLVEGEGFKDFVKLLNPKYKIPSANKIATELIPECYREVEKRSTNSLNDAEGVCLYLDRWKSKSNTYMCIMAHFINSECKFESIFLSCHILVEDESSSDLCERLYETVNNWRIADKIVAVLTDNSDNISGAVQLCNWNHIPHFLLSLSTVMHESLLTLKPLMYKVTSLIEELTTFPETIANIYAKQKELRLQPVKLIKKITKNDCSSVFSTVEMLTRLVKLKTAICRAQQGWVGLKLTESEWKILTGLVDFLNIFKSVKKELLKENRVVLSKVIFFIRAIKQHIKKLQSIATNPSEVTFAVTIAESAISKQFKDLDNMDLVTNILLLDPRLKKHVFEDESESASACSTLKKEVCDIVLPDPCQEEPELEPLSVWHHFDSEVRKLNAVKDPIGKGILELENYLQEQLLNRDEDPLLWWKERRAIYPRLYKLAKKYLCVTAKSVPRESISYKSAYMLSQLKYCDSSPSESEVMFLHHNM